MTEQAILDIAMKYGPTGVALVLAVILYLTIKMFIGFVREMNKISDKKDGKHLAMYNKLNRTINKTLEYQKLQNGGVKTALQAVKTSIYDTNKAFRGFEKTIQKIVDKL